MIDSPRPVNIYIYKIINPWLHFKWRRILFPYVILLENDLLEKSELRKGINSKVKFNFLFTYFSFINKSSQSSFKSIRLKIVQLLCIAIQIRISTC